MSKVLVLYYSSYGHIEAIANAVAEAEETTMPKSKTGSGKNEPAQDSQKLYARAYAARLAKQVPARQCHAKSRLQNADLQNLCADS